MQNKKRLGQFFTTTNPFDLNIFREWLKLVPDFDKKIILEPFAGSNNIVKMIQDLNILNKWICFDVNPPIFNAAPEYKVIQNDSIINFPQNFDVLITNPPYLAKNSARRSKLDFPDTVYDDLYKLCLDVMLKNVDFVAAIIPESFINAKIFQNRLFAFISLTCKMFVDTDCPVCLALFVPENLKNDKDDFVIYRQNVKLGTFKELSKKIPSATLKHNWKFNDKTGNIGIHCIDGLDGDGIVFIKGENIKPENIKVSSRSLTRISGLPNNINLDIFLNECNKILKKYRKETKDVFSTSFKGLRKDGLYRRRLDFATAKIIMNKALEILEK